MNGQPATAKSRTLLLFASTIGALAALFFASNLLVAHRIHTLEVAVSNIAENAAPSVLHLSVARSAVSRIVVALDRMVGEVAAGEAEDPTALEDARRQFDAEIQAYLRIPAFPGEQALWFVVARDTEVMDGLIGAAREQLRERDVAGARRTLLQFERQAEGTMARDIMDVIGLNATQVQLNIANVRRVERFSIDLMWVLDVTSIVLALLIAARTYRSIYSYERKLGELRAQAMDRAAELDQFAARVAHDVRSPLTATRLELESIAKRAAGDHGFAASVARGRRSIDRVVRVVDGLLAFARSGLAPDLDARADASAVVVDLLGELAPQANAAGIDLQAEASAPLEVRCGPDLVGIAVANVVQNAMKYISSSPIRRVRVRLLDKGSIARIEVEDTGPGVPEAIRETMFEPYRRAPGLSQPGLGLGLATVKRICDRYGGRVGYRAVPEGGSVVWLELPTAPASQEAVSAPASGIAATET